VDFYKARLSKEYDTKYQDTYSEERIPFQLSSFKKCFKDKFPDANKMKKNTGFFDF